MSRVQSTSGPASAPGPVDALARRGRVTGRAARLRTPLLAAAGLAAGTLVVALRDPHTAGSYGVCPFLLLTGMPCAACGGLRATYDLAHGDVAGAWDMNPLWVLAVPVLAALWLRWTWRRWRGLPPPPGADRRSMRAAVAAGVLLVGFTVVRNLPGLAPWLAP